MRMRWMLLLLWPASAFAQVAPILDCVTYDAKSQLLVSTWGYANTNSAVVTIIPGSKNFFSPPPSIQGQPVDFQPGISHGVFQTVIDLTSTPSQTWHINGLTETASNDHNKYCVAPAPVACWDTNANLACDPSEDINGDGACDARDCQGRQGATGATGLPGPPGALGPPGPPGPASLLSARVVTVPTSGASATASCNANEMMLSGGGACTVPNTNSIAGRIAASAPASATSWTISCSTGQATAVAICAPVQQ